MTVFKVFLKPFEAPQSEKIKIYVNFLFIWEWDEKG